MLVRLIYASTASELVNHEMIEKILEVSRKNNPANGVTGVLCYGDNIFVQALEGGREQINNLYARLQQDPRHTKLILLDYSEIEARQYSGWTMSKIRLDRINLSLLLKYSATPTLNPYVVSGCTTVALLEELAATGCFSSRD
ncbi:BLUF domain-containing protein [Glaciimonas sp. CA11.2]|uniref:BLUF domain-containing protein n=1 Tax=unclassified Glaciimonas TaxID=2644401 RepID=UPI002AB4CE6B|nr:MULTISPECIES: BLUF domain-containing protein [unclassified Glaciimonas]MDY7545927.1 BLUF domain-containing protein [Glaciimonas sp. CA11.2]MEB0012229.1 BLUF domain-containing protein [Glaciimonas sp. Cout2]MEB0082412.1 BLUF domain-containing protein [Glaciimonas sp. Gout2]MEB0161414.1 BLUF domain-containing protein [Glaciimonas sp. CA11.2]